MAGNPCNILLSEEIHFNCFTLLISRTYITGLLEMCMNSVNIHCVLKDLKMTFVCIIYQSKDK
jgi:hypothetical protein